MAKQQNFPSLEAEIRTAVDTATAAFHLNRKPQTLRIWACMGSGPLKPVRINGRLAWPVEYIKAALRDGFVPLRVAERGRDCAGARERSGPQSAFQTLSKRTWGSGTSDRGVDRAPEEVLAVVLKRNRTD